MSEASSDLASAEQGASNPQIGAVAAQICDRLIGHSKFVPVMLDMKHSLLPLPTAVQKLKLRSPFASILPLVDIQPLSTVLFSTLPFEHVLTTPLAVDQLITLNCHFAGAPNPPVFTMQ